MITEETDSNLSPISRPITTTKNINAVLIMISIYTLSDLGDLSNLIGSLSRTIQQHQEPITRSVQLP